MPGSSGPSSLNSLPVSADPIPELQRLGQRLEQARESQGLSREEQAERLRMGAEQLRALEQGDQNELPEPVFVVAQARRVAASLGVNIDAEISALRSNAAFQARPSRPPAPPPAAPSPSIPVTAAPPPAAPTRSGAGRGPLLLAGAAVLALAGGGMLLRFGNTLTSPPLQPAAPLLQPPSPAQETPGASGASATGETSVLVLRALQPSWLEVRTAAGQVLFRGTLQGERRFPLSSELRVLAGRPDLVTAQGPGQRAQVLGPIEAVRWRSFRPSTRPAPAP